VAIESILWLVGQDSLKLELKKMFRMHVMVKEDTQDREIYLMMGGGLE